MRIYARHPLPGEIVGTACETKLWQEPYDDNPHASVTANVASGQLGIVVASKGNDRFVVFQAGAGWTNVNNLAQIISQIVCPAT